MSNDQPVPSRQQLVRERVWSELRGVARPDSRFHWDFSSFIPDFEGSDACARTVASSPEYQAGGLVFVTPDNSLEALRHTMIVDGRTILATTYGIGRGFLVLDGSDVTADEQWHAATLDGFERRARAIPIEGLAALGPLGLLVTGAASVTTDGVRIGKGHGYFDLEWAILSELGVLAPDPMLFAVVHDCQVLDLAVETSAHDVVVDAIITPSGRHEVRHGTRAPGRVDWAALTSETVARIPCLAEVRKLLEQRRSIA